MKTLFLRKQTEDLGHNVSLVRFSWMLHSFSVTYVAGGHQTTKKEISVKSKESYKPRSWHAFNSKVRPNEGLWLLGELYAQLSWQDRWGLKLSRKTCTAVCCTSWFCQFLLLPPPRVMLSTSHCHRANYTSCCLGTWHSLSLKKKERLPQDCCASLP